MYLISLIFSKCIINQAGLAQSIEPVCQCCKPPNTNVQFLPIKRNICIIKSLRQH